MPKIGLEIHQRLNTGKLFCRCNPDDYKNNVVKVYRKLNLVKSEVFEIDNAALFENKKDNSFIYHYYPTSCCLVELDEEPIHTINREALITALSVALKLDMNVFPFSQVMRKIVLDGSNTSGFQRTALLAIDGVIDNIKIQSLCIEEESAGIISKREGITEYDLSRLGIPLIEIATYPDIKNGRQAKEVAEKIGMLLRMTGRAMRGIGTIRQDLNVSVEGGARVEIKGAQELDLIEKWVEFEIKRQKKLLEILSVLRKNKAFSKMKFEYVDVSEAVYSGFPKKAIENGQFVLAMPLPEHSGLLGVELSPNRRYGSELSDYAKQAGVKGIIHSDENLEKYGIDGKIVKEKLNLGLDDAFVIVVGKEFVVKKALSYVYERANMQYVPKEVRKTLKNGSTSFLRPLPGKARMYPETDLDIIPLFSFIEMAKKRVPKTYEEHLVELKEELKNVDLANKLLHSKYFNIYLDMKESFKEKTMLAYLLTEGFSIASSHPLKSIKTFRKIIEDLMNLYESNKITKKAAVKLMALSLSSGKNVYYFLDSLDLYKISGKKLENLLKEHSFNIKEVMKKYSLKIEGKELKELLNKRKM